jgi:hypothetical protein
VLECNVPALGWTAWLSHKVHCLTRWVICRRLNDVAVELSSKNKKAQLKQYSS